MTNAKTTYAVLFQGIVRASGFTSRKLAHEWAEREILGTCVVLTDRQTEELFPDHVFYREVA